MEVVELFDAQRPRAAKIELHVHAIQHLIEVVAIDYDRAGRHGGRAKVAHYEDPERGV